MTPAEAAREVAEHYVLFSTPEPEDPNPIGDAICALIADAFERYADRLDAARGGVE